jgi:1-acyl-sn-glycerol-3-phosphate acyltransferase
VATLIPANPDPRFARFFGWYNRRLVRRSFAAIRMEATSLDAARSLDTDDRPLIMVINHVGWWDPLIMLELRRLLWPSRQPLAPMDAQQLQRFRFMRKLGIFGIDPDDPASLPLMIDYVSGVFQSTPRASCCITPQGRFTDVREPIRLRPGAAALAAHEPQARVGALAIEYAFWQDRHPEVLLRYTDITPPETRSTPAWHRALTRAMRANAEALAGRVMARDPGAMVDLLGGNSGSINPVYDLLLRVRGRSGPIAARRFSSPTAPPIVPPSTPASTNPA